MAHKHKKQKVWRSEVRLPEEMGHRVRALSNEGRRPMNEQIVMLIEWGLERTTQRAK